MRPRLLSGRRRLVAAASAFGLLAAGAISFTLQAATNPGHSVHVACTHQFGSTELDVDHIASGPDSVAAGSAASLKLEAHQTTFPTESNGIAVNTYENITSRVSLSGGTVASATITAAGSVPATVTVDGNTVTVVIPGPVDGGGTITTPEVTIETSVTAAGGDNVVLTPGSPFYSVRANTSVVGAVNVTCNPADAQQTANATLTIPVGAPDTAPPSVTFIEPNASSVYVYQEEIAAAYVCSDQSAPVTCNGSVAAGAPIDTSTPGVKDFSVTATDALGNTTTETIQYVVLPEGAPAPDRPAFTSLDPARLLDTRSGQVADTVDDQFLGGGKSGGGKTIELVVAGRATVPDNAGAVALTVTATGNEGAGHVTVFPCGQDRPVASNVNFGQANDIRSNAVVTALGDDGKVCLYTFGAATHLVVDVTGYFPFGARYVGLPPGRLLDTRPDKATVDGVEQDGAVPANGEIALQVATRQNVPQSAVAAVLNVTAVSTGGAGYVTVYPCGEQRPTASNVNFSGPTEGAVPNLVIAKLGADGKVCLFAGVGGAHLIVDVAGYLPSGAAYTALNPARLLDTRAGRPTVDGLAAGTGKPTVGTPIELEVAGRPGVAADAGAVVLNITATETDGAGYLKVFPCGAEPNASAVNFSGAGQTRANATLAKLSDDGTVCIVARPSSAHIVVDVAGVMPEQGGVTPPPPPPPTTTTTVPGDTTTTTTDPDATTTTTTVASAPCPQQLVYDTVLAAYNLLPNPLLLTVLAGLDPNGDGNACNG